MLFSDRHSPADWNSSDQTRERTDWQPADWDSSDQTRRATGNHTIHDNEVIFIDPHKGIHGNENNVCS